MQSINGKRFVSTSLGLFVTSLGAFAISACGDERATDSQGAVERHAFESDSAPLIDSARAQELLGTSRARFEWAAADSDDAAVPALLPTAQHVRYQWVGGSLTPSFVDAGAPSPRAQVALPATGDDWARVHDKASALSLAFRLRDAASVPAEHADGYLVYVAGAGTTRFLRAFADGVEDYLLLDSKPERPELRYEVRLDERVAGLRLVGDVLEALDSSGTPRLRVSSPFLVDSNRRRVDGQLEVEGCHVERNPVAPWGREPVPPGSPNCTLIVRWDHTSVTYPALIDPSWASTQAMGTPRALHTAAPNSGASKILYAGGLTTGGAVTKSAEIYDVASNTHAATDNMLTVRQRHITETLSSSSVLVAGGFTTLAGSPTNLAEKYNWSTGKWSSAGSMSVARAAHAASLTNTGKVLVTGGIGPSSHLASAELYNISANTWALTSSSMLAPRAYHTSTARNGETFIAGGYTGSARLASTVVYNAQFNFFESKADLKVARYGHTATKLASGDIFIAGGMDGLGSTASTELFRYSKNQSRRSANLTYPRRHHTATLLPTTPQSLLIAGGTSATGSAIAQSELFDTTWETLANTAVAGTARAHHTAVATGTRVIIAGGSPSAAPGTSSTYLSSTEAYDSAGLLPTVRRDYKFMAAVDPDVLSTTETEIWGSLYSPATLSSGRYPVIVMLHGMHGTCGKPGVNPDDARIDDNYQYSKDGQCPAPYSVVHNHRGYDYLASALAARGYLVVSVNGNRGLGTDRVGPPGDEQFILARGKLVLKHLQRLSEWDRGIGSPEWVAGSPSGPSLVNRVHISEVGLMGHSRGGGGVRAALSFFRDPTSPSTGNPWSSRIPGLAIRGILEFASPSLSPYAAHGVNWAFVVGHCDEMKPWGIAAFDRVMMNLGSADAPPTFKATYSVWGANHNYWNTEWQLDNGSCQGPGHEALFEHGKTTTGSAQQRQAGFVAVMSFFVGSVGANKIPTLTRIFNPVYPVPPVPRVDRGYTPTTNSETHVKVLESFSRGAGTNTYGVANNHVGIGVTHGSRVDIGFPGPGMSQDFAHHDPLLRAAKISWTSGGATTYFQSNFANLGAGFDLSGYHYLDMRLDRVLDTAFETPLNTDSTTTFTVRLLNSNDTVSTAVSSGAYVTLMGPVGFSTLDANANLQTLRIPLTAFSGATLSAIRGVRLTFSGTSKGRIYLANIHATKNVTGQGSD